MTSPIVEKSPEALLHPLYFKKYINVSAIKLSQDQCYSEKTRKEFDGYEVSLDDANETYQYIRDMFLVNSRVMLRNFTPNFTNVCQRRLFLKIFLQEVQFYLVVK